MSRYVLTEADREMSVAVRSEKGWAYKVRREAELALLDRLRAEAAMREWYPHQ